MNENEKLMKERGEARVWKTLVDSKGNYKKLSTIPLVQQILLVEAERILPEVEEWVEVGTAKSYRIQAREYFASDEVDMLECILGVYLFIAGYTYVEVDKRARHKNINTIVRKVLIGADFDLAWRFTEVVIDLSTYFESQTQTELLQSGFVTTIKYRCNLDEVLLKQLSIQSHAAFLPAPSLLPPKDWQMIDQNIIGGYHDYQMDFVRGSQSNTDLPSISQSVLDSVNYIQSVPWKVNAAIVNQINSDLSHPNKDDFIKIEFPEIEEGLFDIDLDENHSLSVKEIKLLKAQRQKYGEAAELYNAEKRDYLSAVGKYRAISLAIDIAAQYVDQVIYFPHSLDFRGRIYPLPVMLSPQGSDEVKAMLEYEKGEVLTPQGTKWMWAYYASLFGDDKIHFDERVLRGIELYADNTNYLEADEPYQFLAHKLEIDNWMNDPTTYEFKGRIHLDACNSGSQFTSAITGDKVGCINTNVIPDVVEGKCVRHDAYMLVAQSALDICNEQLDQLNLLKKQRKDYDKEQLVAVRFFIKLLTKDGRKVCKRPVMVSNYGGTAGGRTEILYDMFRELGIDRVWTTKKNASKLSKIIGNAIGGTLRGGKLFERYIHEMNNLIAKNDVAVTWSTSDGFPVSHAKMKITGVRRIECLLPNSRKKTRIETKRYSKDKFSIAKMKSAIAPNYIHSLDAELLRRVALQMKKAEIKDSDWIHDSFGSLPNHVDQMLFITKNEFRKMMRKMPLKVLHEQLSEQVEDGDKVKIPTRPSLKGFDAEKGGLDCVLDSEWFFS